MTTYNRGRHFEHKVKKFLESEGYFVVRAAGSKGPVDLLGVRRTGVVMVSCRIGGKMTRAEIERFMEIAEDAAASPLLAYKSGTTWAMRSLMDEES